MKILGVHGRRWSNGSVFVVRMEAASCHKPVINSISLDVNFYSSGSCSASAEDQEYNFEDCCSCAQLKSKEMQTSHWYAEKRGGEKNHLNSAKTNWWKYIYLCSFLYIQYIFYFGQIQNRKGFITLLQAYVKDELGEFQQNKMLNLASGETFQLREPLGWNNHLK